MRALDALCNRPWLGTMESLQTIVDIVTREHRDEELAALIRAEREERPAALAMRQGQRLEGTRNVMVRDGVAHVPIIGPIVRRADFFTRVSGLTSIEAMAADFQAAVQAPEVKAILLEVDSPGGEVTAVASFSEAIYAARQVKPVWAYVDGLAASAGYWLASAASRVVTDPAGMLGSIGAVLAVRDPSKGPEARSVEFVSSQSPFKRASPLTDDGRAQYQRIVDQTAEAFVEAVARNRGVAIETVLSDFGQGGMLVGRYAVAANLADEVGTFETALASLAASVRRQEPYMDWKKMWGGFFAAAQDAGAITASDGTPLPVAASLVGAEPPAEPAAAAAPPPADNDGAARVAAAEERAREAEARAAELEAAQQQAKVSAFVEEAIRAGRALPAERAALAELYTRAAAAGFGPQVEALINARPAHALTVEQVPAGAAVLPAARPVAAEGEMTPERRQQLLAATPEGKAALAART